MRWRQLIFVVSGTQKFPMDRLFLKIDELIEEKMLSESVYAQIGNSDYKPKHFEFTDFLQKQEFEEKISGCDLLITHAGVGTIMAGLSRNKPIIVVPRRAEYGEHIDNHQVEIAHSFSEANYVLQCKDVANLIELIKTAKAHEFSKYVSNRRNVINTIREYLNSF